MLGFKGIEAEGVGEQRFPVSEKALSLSKGVKKPRVSWEESPSISRGDDVIFPAARQF